MNIWEEAKQVNLKVSKGIKPGFDNWFDKESRNRLRENFVLL